MKDYYEILGLEEDASQEEIRERWLELTKLYHPDLLQSPDADERIKEINEAYQVLKDYSSRLEYDLQRALQKSVLKKVVEKEEKKFPWPKVILPAGVLTAVVLMIFYIVIKIPTKHEEELKMPVPEEAKIKVITPPPAQAPGPTAELEKGKLQEIPKAIAPRPSREEEKPMTAVAPVKLQEKKPTLAKVVTKEAKKEPAKVKIPTPLKTPEAAKIIPPGKPPIQPQKLESSIKAAELEEPKEIEKTIPSAAAKVEPPPPAPAPEPRKLEVPEKLEKPKDVAKAPGPEAVKTLMAQPPELKQEQKLEKVEETKETPKPVELVTDIKPEPVKVMAPQEPQIMEAKKPEKLEKPEKIMPSKEEEVKKFLAGYVSKYQQKDAEGFLSYFSAQAIQNQKYKLTDIKRIYKNFFDHSQELSYILADVQTADHPQGFEVKAKYELHQVTKKEGEKKSWKGQIRWILSREDGRLKIISLDYQHQK